MSERRDNLKKFLAANQVGQSDIDQVMTDLEPYFKQADAGQVAFSADPDQEEVRQAVSLVIGKAVNRVIFASASVPWPKPEWMAGEVYAAYARGSFQESIGISLWGVLRDSFHGGYYSLALGLDTRFGVSQSLPLRFGIASCLRDSLGTNIQDALGSSLYYYVGFVMAGKKEVAAKLAPLVRVMARNPVLGEKADEPGAWIALKA